MQLHADWHAALESARLGNLTLARVARDEEPATPLVDYFFARCLAEAPAIEDDQYGQAAVLLGAACQAQPSNPLFVQAHALALARQADPLARPAAAAIWSKQGLPHDLDLLAQAALTIEMELRPLPDSNPLEPMDWPASLPQRAPLQSDILTREEEPSDAPGDGGPLPARGGRRLNKAIGRMENELLANRPEAVVRESGALLAAGLESGELHLVAGIAAEESGVPDRARAHLSRALRMQPQLLMARTALARAYWREGRLELAMALWRSLPVEGPYDYGRHYHLALGYEALGDRAAALKTMRLALADFFYDTRHFFIKRSFERWVAMGTAPARPAQVA